MMMLASSAVISGVTIKFNGGAMRFDMERDIVEDAVVVGTEVVAGDKESVEAVHAEALSDSEAEMRKDGALDESAPDTGGTDRFVHLPAVRVGDPGASLYPVLGERVRAVFNHHRSGGKYPGVVSLVYPRLYPEPPRYKVLFDDGDTQDDVLDTEMRVIKDSDAAVAGVVPAKGASRPDPRLRLRKELSDALGTNIGLQIGLANRDEQIESLTRELSEANSRATSLDQSVQSMKEQEAVLIMDCGGLKRKAAALCSDNEQLRAQLAQSPDTSSEVRELKRQNVELRAQLDARDAKQASQLIANTAGAVRWASKTLGKSLEDVRDAFVKTFPGDLGAKYFVLDRHSQAVKQARADGDDHLAELLTKDLCERGQKFKRELSEKMRPGAVHMVTALRQAFEEREKATAARATAQP